MLAILSDLEVAYRAVTLGVFVATPQEKIMKKLLITLFFNLTVASSASWAADCNPPTQPNMPDGDKASMEEMLKGKSAITNYQKENATYRDCVNEKIAQAIDAVKSASDEKSVNEAKANHQRWTESYNQAVSNEEQVAKKFNNALHAYKAANPS